MLSEDQRGAYERDGYLILRDVLAADDAASLRTRIKEGLDAFSFPPSLKYPSPGKYTISGNHLAEPGFADIAGHGTVVEAVEDLLGEPAHLTAYVAYLRSPGDKGSGAHSDYKRWRPVGSSMDWLFAIVPLTDFNDEYGPLLVSPGSHRLSAVVDPDVRILDVPRPDAKQLAEFIDPELKAGDLLLMHGHTWHKAPAGTTDKDRVGIFNKYCGVSAPPAAGYYPYTNRAADAMEEMGRLIPNPDDRPIETTRLLIEHRVNGEPRFLAVRDGDRWMLPGGAGWEEEDVGWDVGARVGAVQSLTRDQIGVEVPWASWITDVDEGVGRCRLYGYVDDAIDVDDLDGDGRAWLTGSELESALQEEPIGEAIDMWLSPEIRRGKGKAIAQRKQQFE